jgi:polysaccharide biosynthesis/export protein ExoF
LTTVLKAARKALLVATLMALPMAAHGEYRLGPADAVRIKVQEWSEVGGDFTINPDGKLLLPVVGSIDAAGMSIPQLSQTIAAGLARSGGGQGQGPFASVEIIRFRPIYVLGDVQRPGEFEFRPGLSALQAISMAGGYYRPTESGAIRVDRDIANALGDLEAQRLRLFKAQASAARLEAALAGASDISFPADLTDRAELPAIAELLANERRLLMSEQQRGREEAEALQRIKTLYETEIESMNGQAEALEREEKMLRKQLESLRSLTNRGLALTPNIITMERTLSQNQNERLSVSTGIARARQSIELGTDRVRANAAERQRRNGEELRLARAETAEAKNGIETASALLREARTVSGTIGNDAASRIMEPRQLMIQRRGDGADQTLEAKDETALLPGDVLKVIPLPAHSATDPATTGDISSGP